MSRFARSLGLFLFAAQLCAGCAGGPRDGEIRAVVSVLAAQEGSPVTRALDKVASLGRPAIVIIEAALHTANPAGRKNLILGLRRIHDVDAVALLRHLAVYDSDETVRNEAQWTLSQWAIEQSDLGDKSRKALRAVDELKGREEPG